MASTKHMTRSVRKGVKKAQRRRLKDLFAGMTREVRRAFRKREERHGLKKFLEDLKSED